MHRISESPRQDICEHECGGDRRNNQNTPCRDACDAAERRPFSLGIEYTLDGFSAAPKSNQRMSAALQVTHRAQRQRWRGRASISTTRVRSWLSSGKTLYRRLV